MKKYVFLLLFITPIFVNAQDSIKIHLTDSTLNKDIVGARLLSLDSIVIATTDEYGNAYVGSNYNHKSVNVQHIGYKNATINIESDSAVYNLAKFSVDKLLEEVIVIGYGTQKKTDVIGAVSTVDGNDMAKRTGMRASAALQGMAPGVSVSVSSGQPGADGGTIRVRGIGTLSDANALVLVDGVESSMDGVDPNSIASVSVLKDASSASIYGSRAANGVILITTKSAKQGALAVNYNGSIGFQKATTLPQYVDGYTYMTKMNEAFDNLGQTRLYTDDYLQQYQAGKVNNPDEFPDVDWIAATFSKTPIVYRNYISITGGTKQLKTIASFGYQNQTGLIPNYKADRYNFNSNTQWNITNNLTASINILARHGTTFDPNQGGNSDIISGANRTPAIYAVKFSNGNWGTALNGGNPVAFAEEGGNSKSIYEQFRITAQIKYEPIKNLSAEFSYTPDMGKSDIRDYKKSISSYVYGATTPSFINPTKSSLSRSYASTLEQTLRFLLRYNYIKNLHNVSLLGGYEQIEYKTDGFSAFRDNFLFPEYSEINSGDVSNQQTSGSSDSWGLLSYFGRFNYTFDRRYMFEANVRIDGSSRFASNNRYGTFPSFALGWRLSEEKFMRNIQWLDELKLRTSVGVLGNQNVGGSYYPYQSLVSIGSKYIFGGAVALGAAQGTLANEKLTWESTLSKDLGIDLQLFQKWNLTADIYERKTKDILLTLDIPDYIGLGAPYQNAGKVLNRGWEFALSYSNQINKFKYRITGNISNVMNKVTDLKGTGPYISSLSVIEEGYAINSLYGYKSQGIFKTTEEVANHAKQLGSYGVGDIIYEDLNDDKVIDSKDKTVIGNPISRYTYGINLSASYQNFDISAMIQGVGKREVILNEGTVWAFYNAANLQKWQLDAYSAANPNGKYPRLISATTHNNFNGSDFWVFNAAYMRVKNIQLGYSPIMKSSGKIKSMRIYLTGDNLFTISHLPDGWDPERTNGGLSSQYPNVKSYVLGINLNF